MLSGDSRPTVGNCPWLLTAIARLSFAKRARLSFAKGYHELALRASCGYEPLTKATL
jgi:hypothetical protein